uniref:Uncharacterized protein n=1 Tax=Heterorhabditis bacteriophora TaxID=37862 RepID=A0A1I7WCH2_HETBA
MLGYGGLVGFYSSLYSLYSSATHQNLLESSCFDLWSEVSAQGETKLRNIFEKGTIITFTCLKNKVKYIVKKSRYFIKCYRFVLLIYDIKYIYK